MNDLNQQSIAESQDSRSTSRTNLFVSAALYGDGDCCAAKIRNLSATGALVEAPVLPSAGTQIRLRRGNLEVGGEVVWCEGGRAGLKFTSVITVADWLPRRQGADQARVDEIVHQVRMGPAHARFDQPNRLTDAAPSQDIEAATSLIERVADALTTDAHVVAHHGWKLQQLEVAVQQIRRFVRSQ